MPNTLRLPVCSCNRVETLGRSWDVHPNPLCRSALHRRAINRLFALLIELGFVDPSCAPIYEAETQHPADVDPRDPRTETIVVPLTDPPEE